MTANAKYVWGSRRLTRSFKVWRLTCALAMGTTVGGKAATLESFAYSSPEAAQKVWRPAPGTPPVQIVAKNSGCLFPCQFANERDRVYWDRDLRADLSQATSIHLDLQCDNPSALRSPTLYVRSGKGWYVGRIPLRGSGRQLVFINRSAFATEGRPSGWNRIEGLRISAWRADSQNTHLRLYDLRAEADPVLVVKNTLSSPSPAERNYGNAIAARISGWLTEVGIPHGVITDEEVIHGGLMNGRVAILSYHPHPPAREIASLKYFVQRGGKLIVFYGAEPALAELMDVQLESYLKAERPGQWASFVFSRPSYWNVPEQVFQNSPNIMPARPASYRAQTIATWQDAQGRPTGHAAWIASESGFWMTHVLLGDAPLQKREMLLGLVGSLVPDVWIYAARDALQKVGQIDSFRTMTEACRQISAAAARHPEQTRIEELLRDAAQDYDRMQRAFEKRQYAEAVALARSVRRLLTQAYAEVQSPRPRELRGVWDHSGMGWFPGDWNRSCKLLQEFGFNTLFVNSMWAGLAHYPSKVLPPSAIVRMYGDPLGQCVEAARRYGLAVHVWFVCWNLENAPPDFVEEMRKQGRLQQSANGSTVSWLCPSHSENRRLALNALREVATTYPVQGIHLDYVRFPNAQFCYCSNCRSEFERAMKQKVRHWPRDVLPGGTERSAYVRWRADQITRFVREVRETVRAARSDLYVSAAVWGAYPTTVESIGQDWGLWLKQNMVDFVCPMNYTSDNARFAELTRTQLALPNAGNRLYPGIGVTAQESQLEPDQVIEQILLLRRLGAPGFVLFDMSQTLRTDTLPMLQKGLTQPVVQEVR
jgi:uncharacterized lipoprotein YddW (UPF0748 family)